MNEAERWTRHRVNMEMAEIISKRGTCNRAQVGCVIALEGRIVSTGYVGAPAGMDHCLDVGCLPGPDGGCIRTSHAEAGAIAFAAKKGVAIEGATLYTTLSPCLPCAKDIINAGIKEVVYKTPYRDLSGVSLLNQAGIKVHQYGEEL